MDGTGARELQKRLEGQEHWRQAEAVRDGRQPPADADAHELEEIRDGLRLYGHDQQRPTAGGQDALITFRVVKRLVDGFWERSLIREEAVDENETESEHSAEDALSGSV